MSVHSHLGLGFPEIIYKRSLLIELEKAGVKYQSVVIKNVLYERKLIENRRLDLIVKDVVLIELKAVKNQITPVIIKF